MTKVNVRAAILYVCERTHEYQIIRHCTLSSAVQLRYGTVRYGTAQYGLAFRDFASDFLKFASKPLLLFRTIIQLFCDTSFFNLLLTK